MKPAYIALVLPLVACQAEFREAYLPSPGAATATPAAPTATANTGASNEAPAAPQGPASPANTGAEASTAPTATPAAVASGAPATTSPAPAPTGTGSMSGTVEVRPKAAAGNLTNIVVWLDNPPNDQPPKDAGASAVLDQHGMNFFPAVTIVRVGGKVTFLNDDPFPHNVFTPDGDKFNLGTMPHGSAAKRVFDKPGRFTLLCNLHPNMIAYLVVTPSSWFVRPDKDGKFTMAGVPSGTYTVKAWGPRLSEASQQVTIKDGDVPVEFHLQRAD